MNASLDQSRRPARRPVRRPVRRGSTIIIVLWTISIAALASASAQLLAYRQATVGRLSLERVQARWAARAGIEQAIAVMAQHTQFPIPDDAFALQHDLENVAFGELVGARYDILRSIEGEDWAGPSDESGRLNINSVNSGLLLAIFDGIGAEQMTFDVADAITDWIDPDEDPGALGVEGDYYLSLNPPYQPRNEAMRSVVELELVAGIWPEYLRGEDWNMNRRRDINENDGSRTLPLDNNDGRLDAGWAEFLTAYSVDTAPTMSGLPRLWLRAAEPEDVMDRCGVTEAQANSLVYFGRNPENKMESLFSIDIRNVDDSGNVAGNIVNSLAEPLEEDELRAVLDECSVNDPLDRLPGRVNLNTVSPVLLRKLMEALSVDEAIADEMLYLRDRPQGIVSLEEIRDIAGLTDQLWGQLLTMLTTRSSVYMISSRGRGDASDTEVEIIAVVDRSTVPIKILEYREQ